MRDKNGHDVTIYALSYGLCEAERFAWGYPRGRRDDRSYFVQRCFNYSGIIRRFLTSSQTIECGSCGACFGMDRKDVFEMYKWRCPECEDGKCSIVTLGHDFQDEVRALDDSKMLDPVELEILESLNEESMPLRAKEIGALIDATYQLVGHRTAKMQDIGLVKKFETLEGKKSELTDKARGIYFSADSSEQD